MRGQLNIKGLMQIKEKQNINNNQQPENQRPENQRPESQQQQQKKQTKILKLSYSKLKLICSKTNLFNSICAKWTVGLCAGIIISGLLLLISFGAYYRNRIYQGITIDHVAVGGLTRSEALTKLEQAEPKQVGVVQTRTSSAKQENQHQYPQQKPLNFIPPLTIALQYQDKQTNLNLAEITQTKDYQLALDHALSIGRSKNLWHRAQTVYHLIQNPVNIRAHYQLDTTQIKQGIEEFKKQVDQPGIMPKFELETSGAPASLKFIEGQDELKLDVNSTLNNLFTNVQNILSKIEAGNEALDTQTFNEENINHSNSDTENHDAEAPFSEIPNRKTLNNREEIEIKAIVQHTKYKLTEDELEAAREKALAMVGQSLDFSTQELKENQLPDHPSINKTLNDQQLIGFLTWPSGFNLEQIQQQVETWAEEIDQPAVDAVFEYDQENLEVKEFSPHREGIELDRGRTEQQIKDWLQDWLKNFEKENLEKEAEDSGEEPNEEKKLEDSAEELDEEKEGGNEEKKADGEENNAESSQESNSNPSLHLRKTEPETTLAETNDLGIQELIGFGESFYYGSIASRVHNVAVAADKLSLTIVEPQEEFSFVKAIGPVNAATGFRNAYVIRSGSTILEYGGGVCQVSTTAFRAFLNAGVDITRRLPHSYRVSYYEINQQPGFDATVYTGAVDLRFINDTPGHLLIYSKADSERRYMIVEVYGTDDGRSTEITNYQKYGYSSPPETQYIPDPSLAPGEMRRVENAVPGIKTSFDWIVRDKNGEVIREKTFHSNYRAWAARYLVGE